MIGVAELDVSTEELVLLAKELAASLVVVALDSWVVEVFAWLATATWVFSVPPPPPPHPVRINASAHSGRNIERRSLVGRYIIVTT